MAVLAIYQDTDTNESLISFMLQSLLKRKAQFGIKFGKKLFNQLSFLCA